MLTEGHASLRDDFEISTDELDACVDAALAAGAHGARMVGGGFGGSAVVLVDRDRAGAVADAVRDEFGRRGFAAPRTFDVIPSAGARRLGVIVRTGTSRCCCATRSSRWRGEELDEVEVEPPGPGR